MNILLLAPHPFFQHRGTPIAVKLLMEVLSENGHDIQMLTYHEGEDVDIPNVSIRRIPTIPWLRNIKPGPSWKKLPCDILMFWKCINTVRLSKFDLIHAIEESALIGLVVKKIFKTPYIYDMDSSIPQQIVDKYILLRPIKAMIEFIEKIVVKNSNGVIAVCKTLERIALNYDQRKKVLRLEDVSLLKSETRNGDLLSEELGISGPIIMYVGNLEGYQGIDLLLEGFRHTVLNEKDAQLVVIGGSEEGIQQYTNKSQQLGIGNKVHFIGQRPVSQLSYYLKQADIVVSPRIKGQNTPMKIYSYLDSGKPLVATRISSHTQVLDDNIALLVLPEPEEFGEGLVKLLKDNALKTSLANRAKARVKQEFSYEVYQRKLLRFYKTIEEEVLQK